MDTESEKHNKCAIKRKINFGNYKNYLERTQLDNKVHYIEKNWYR